MKRIFNTFLLCIFILTFVSCFVFLGPFFKNDETEIINNYVNEKKVSFLGDSISTYEGYSNNASYNSTIGSNAVWYDSSKIRVNDTYWKRTIDKFGLHLVVNNSWSGSYCSGTATSSACNTRAKELQDNDGVEPDIIVVYIGINDFDGNVAVDTFSQAYSTMVNKITEKYIYADVYLCNLLPNNKNTNYDLLKQYNQNIENVANKFNCTLVDFYNNSGITQSNFGVYTIDGLHPNVGGHSLMAKCLQNKLLEKYKLQ